MGNNLKEIKRKISSVENTKKTTKAMKLVSSSKLRKAELMARQSRVYAQKFSETFDILISAVKVRGLESVNSKLFSSSANRTIKTTDIIVITSDKGLCGNFNSATIKEAMKIKAQREQSGINVRMHAIGKKAIGFFSYNKIELLTKEEGLSSAPKYDHAANILRYILDDFLNDKTGEVVLVYNGFKNMLSQELSAKSILPLDLENEIKKREHNNSSIVYVEPDDAEEEILEQTAKKYFEYTFYYGLISSLAGEHSARMQAMDAASNNASALIKNLTISYNKARQEAITTELVEINAGAEAIK